MKLTIYLRLQRCTTKNRKAFVPRQNASHGIAAGEIRYYALETSSWARARQILKGFDVMGHSQLTEKSAQGFTQKPGQPAHTLLSIPTSLVPNDIRYTPQTR